MTLPISNTEEAALRFCEDAIGLYLGAHLAALNAAYSVSLQMPSRIERDLIFPQAVVPTWMALRPTNETTELVHDRQKAIIEVTVRVVIHGPSSGLVSATALSGALSLYTEAVLTVLQRHVRGGRDGVYHCERHRRTPARQVVTKLTPSGAFSGSRDCGVRIYQQQPI